MPPAPLLVFGVGNPSRGDDALGPRVIERLADALAGEIAAGEVELLTDFQLQVEHALDLTGRRRVVFVDASVAAPAPYAFGVIEARRDGSHSSHAMSPEALLDAHARAIGAPPPAWVMAIHGERFALGAPLSATADAHLDAAVARLVSFARDRDDARAAVRVELEGTVQGVGLRPWVRRVARALGLTGIVRNTARGVLVEAHGARSVLDALVDVLRDEAPPPARVRAMRVTEAPAGDFTGFTIEASEPDGAAALALSPDLGPCDACLAELRDPAARRHGYAFTACAACGPRLAVALALPYDRARTTMAPFALCDACRAEYDAPDDRRVHAQSIACPACGPRVWLADPRGVERPSADALADAAAMLRDGRVLAVQGVGAFHLVCDATRDDAVRALRRAKRRDQQPLAVMAADEGAARALARLDATSMDLLRSAARPVVLAPSRPGALAPSVCGPSRRTGVMLPYSPLHATLATRVGRPLVVTSGNAHGGPAAIDHEAAVRELGAGVDGFVLHDRVIARRVEDSVVTVHAGAPRVLRRSRGYAPTPIRLPAAAPEPVLAVGAHARTTACLVVDDLAYLTPHLGDLERVEGERAWRREVESFERLLGVKAEVLAHDLHPDYATTRYAMERDARRRVGVQHHAAHALAAVAELGLDEPVLAVVFDGTGWGPDETAWGGEFLLVDGARWTRVNTFRALRLPGGERAIREVWRLALSALRDAYGAAEALALAPRLGALRDVPPSSRETVTRAMAAGVMAAPARGVGRWFDAVGALALGLPRADFDAHVAVALEECAGDDVSAGYPVGVPAEVSRDGVVTSSHEVDLRVTVRAVVDDVLAGVSAATVSSRFHRALVDATVSTAEAALAATGARRVVLSGGCMQNERLARGISQGLGAHRVSMAREVPVNDGGVSLGQAWAAVMALATGG